MSKETSFPELAMRTSAREAKEALEMRSEEASWHNSNTSVSSWRRLLSPMKSLMLFAAAE
jgi:hypothetical protein